MSEIYSVSIDNLQKWMEETLWKFGLPEGHAKAIADVLMDCELRGYEDHGAWFMGVVSWFYNTHGMNANPKVRILKDITFTVTITEIVDGQFKTKTEERHVKGDRMMPAEDIIRHGDESVTVFITENQTALFSLNDVEIHNFEPDKNVRVGGCCNHGG